MSQQTEPTPSNPPCPRCGKPMRLATAEPTTPYVNISEARFVCDCGEDVRAMIVHD